MTRAALWVGCVVLLCIAGSHEVQAQPKPDSPDIYGARNTFGAVAEYSNDSSHIVLGTSQNVKLGAVGVQYQRRLIATRYIVFSYAAEFRPVILESNPTVIQTTMIVSPTPFDFTLPRFLVTKCEAATIPFKQTSGTPPVTYTGYFIDRCGRELTYAQGLSPIGLRINLRPHKRLQPTFSGFAGYILSAKALPISSAGSFNYSFELGAGLEYYLARHRSVRVEYQVQHYSNDYTANSNPGVDSGIFKLTYSFGR